MSRKKILLIDDDLDLHDLIDIILKKDFIDLITITDISIAAIANAAPDLILLDEWLADKNGSTLCAELKNNKETAGIPVILISAVYELEAIAKRCRADAFIAKPFDIYHLQKAVDSFLNNGGTTYHAEDASNRQCRP